MKIKSLARQNPAKSCKIRTPRATKNRDFLLQNRQTRKGVRRLQQANPSLARRLATQDRINSEVKRCSVNTRSEMASGAERVLSSARIVARYMHSLSGRRSLAAREVVGEPYTAREI